MAEVFDVFISEADFRRRYEYTPADLLGEGGFAQVYKAFDKQFHEYVALKFYNKGEKGKYDVLHEMKDSRSFSHKNIIRVHDAFVVRFEKLGTHSFAQVGVLEFASGGNLRDFVDSKPSEDAFIDVLIGILEGLKYLHIEKKIIHRDLSPENILLYLDGNRWIPKISDFGISKKLDIDSLEKNKKKSTQLLGKIEYMAPEQFYPDTFGINGNINTNVDLWSFGIILYELFMQKTPFGNQEEENPMTFIHSITSNSIPFLDEVPNPYRKVIEMCLVKEASRRISNPQVLIDILTSKKAQPVKEPSKTIPLGELGDKKRTGLKWAGILIFFVILILTGSYFLWIHPGSGPVDPLPEIKTLVSENRYSEALQGIKNLPEKLRNNHEIKEIERTCVLQIGRDSAIELFNAGYFSGLLNYLDGMPEDLRSDSILTTLSVKSNVQIARDSLETLISRREYAKGKAYYSGLTDPVKKDRLLKSVYEGLQKSIRADSLYQLGTKLFAQKKYDEAKSLFEDVASLNVFRKQDADSMLVEIRNLLKPKETQSVKALPAGCLQYYEKNDLHIASLPSNREIELKSICVSNSEMKVTLIIKPTSRIVTIYNPLSEKSFYVEYDNGTRQLPLKDIKGIITNTQQRIDQNKTLELIFDKLPANIQKFSLMEGRNQKSSEKYWNFIGIALSN